MRIGVRSFVHMGCTRDMTFTPGRFARWITNVSASNAKRNDFFCIDRCPEQALTLRRNPILETLGDYRWTSEMLISHWVMAETGNLPIVDLEYNLGNSGGGFDKIRFKTPEPDDYLDHKR